MQCTRFSDTWIQSSQALQLLKVEDALFPAVAMHVPSQI